MKLCSHNAPSRSTAWLSFLQGHEAIGANGTRVTSFELETPRDRAGSFEPQLVKKHQTHLTDEIERKILSLFGLGMSYQDIASHVAELYGLSVSSATISAVTDKLIPELEQ